MKSTAWISLLVFFCGLCTAIAPAADPWVVYDGFEGPGRGKHVVLVSGDLPRFHLGLLLDGFPGLAFENGYTSFSTEVYLPNY